MKNHKFLLNAVLDIAIGSVLAFTLVCLICGGISLTGLAPIWVFIVFTVIYLVLDFLPALRQRKNMKTIIFVVCGLLTALLLILY